MESNKYTKELFLKAHAWLN